MCYQHVVDRGRESLSKLDSNADFQIDPACPKRHASFRGMPAVKGQGRCIVSGRAKPPDRRRNDFWADVCVQTDPGQPTRAPPIVRQVIGQITPDCSCTNATGSCRWADGASLGEYLAGSVRIGDGAVPWSMHTQPVSTKLTPAWASVIACGL